MSYGNLNLHCFRHMQFDSRGPFFQDRRPITVGDLIEPLPPTELTQIRVREEDNEDTNASSLRGGSSAKIDQLVHLLQLTPATEKSLVFSQFTGFLDKARPIKITRFRLSY